MTIDEIRERLEDVLPKPSTYEQGRWGIFYKNQRIPISWGGGVNSYGNYNKALHSLYNVANRIGPYYKEDKDEYKRIIDQLINNKEIEIKQL